jgi:hypothetical protein
MKPGYAYSMLVWYIVHTDHILCCSRSRANIATSVHVIDTESLSAYIVY